MMSIMALGFAKSGPRYRNHDELSVHLKPTFLKLGLYPTPS
jgi:hypothetical protein